MFSFLFAERKSFIVKVPCLSPRTVCSSILNAWAVPHPSILCCSSSGSIPVVCKKAPNLWQADGRNNRHFQQQKPALPARSISRTTISCTKGWYLTQYSQWSLICPSHTVAHFPSVSPLTIIQVQTTGCTNCQPSNGWVPGAHFCVTTRKSEKEKFQKKQWWCETFLNSFPR